MRDDALTTRYERLVKRLLQLNEDHEILDLGSSISALHAAIRFLSADDRLYRSKAITPLYTLFNALLDTFHGAEPAYLFRWKMHGRPRLPSQAALQGQLGALAASVIGQTGMQAPVVARLIIAQLRTRYVVDASGNQITVEQILRWRFRSVFNGRRLSQMAYDNVAESFADFPLASPKDVHTRIEEFALRLALIGFSKNPHFS